ncbi:acetyl-CoA acetyltransferase [Dactylosporangium sp. NPDC000244]|uniref:acetyl-CoA acetyltransferase n=1 Tax=Dactylosporangium sp. NPDC000244 TaxID=3154365 RepID=UPI0033328D61
MTRPDRTPVIAGIGLSDGPKAPHLDALGHQAQAMQRALADSGLSKHDIDGFGCAEAWIPGVPGVDLPETAEYLGLDPQWIEGTYTGGSAYEFQVQHAEAAIRSGMANTILLTYGSDLLTRMGRSLGTAYGRKPVGGAAYEEPYGKTTVAAYAMAAQRHMYEYGTTPEQLASVAVAVREHAAHNPQAIYRKPLTVDDVLNSRMIADPLHLFDCCAVTDGGGAVIVTTEERARDLKQPFVSILGTAARQNHWNISQAPDVTTTAGTRSGPDAFARAGLSPNDVDMAMLYDSFTITVILLLESLGFCKPGEGGPFAEEGNLRLGGRLPINTDGGGLSACHPGLRGIFLLIEAVRQLRGQAGAVQVPDCEVALAAGSGGWFSTIGVTILGKNR